MGRVTEKDVRPCRIPKFHLQSRKEILPEINGHPQRFPLSRSEKVSLALGKKQDSIRIEITDPASLQKVSLVYTWERAQTSRRDSEVLGSRSWVKGSRFFRLQCNRDSREILTSGIVAHIIFFNLPPRSSGIPIYSRIVSEGLFHRFKPSPQSPK